MINFYVSKKKEADGTHEVHTGRCVFLPRAKSDSIPLGQFNHCAEAVEAAKTYYRTSTGCFFCSHDCHIREEIRKEEAYVARHT